MVLRVQIRFLVINGSHKKVKTVQLLVGEEEVVMPLLIRNKYVHGRSSINYDVFLPVHTLIKDITQCALAIITAGEFRHVLLWIFVAGTNASSTDYIWQYV